MGADELLDEDAFDPKKLFNEEEYSTLIINRDGFSKKENLSADLIESLLENELSRAESEEIFSKLKTSNAHKMLVDAIRSAAKEADKTKLVAACWECGLDFSAEFLLFVELSCHQNFQLALEALTVVESIETQLPKETIATAIEIAESASDGQRDLIHDLIENLKSRLND